MRTAGSLTDDKGARQHVDKRDETKAGDKRVRPIIKNANCAVSE